jgi:SAM-dependent methyltransferase
VTEQLEDVYAQRFGELDAARKDRIWREIARYLQRHVDRDAVVLDLACDRGDFIRNIVAGEKWASDLRDVSGHLSDDVRFVQEDGLSLIGSLPSGHFDVVFMSNYLEHLPSSEAVIEQLRVARELLKPGGRAIVLQPNVRLVGGAYWDFIDHHVALTEKSIVEAAELAGYRAEVVIPRFLPYTTKSRLPQSAILVGAYLRLRPAWLLFGKQSLYVGKRT